MLFRDLVELIAITQTQDQWGDPIEQETAREVYANKKSVRQSEFYQAAITGLRPELMFEVRTMEYAGERWLRYGGKKYEIIRTFSKNDEITELICSGLVGQ